VNLRDNGDPQMGVLELIGAERAVLRKSLPSSVRGLKEISAVPVKPD